MLTGWQSSKRICVAEHFEDEQQMSQCQVGEKTGKVVCHQHFESPSTFAEVLVTKQCPVYGV